MVARDDRLETHYAGQQNLHVRQLGKHFRTGKQCALYRLCIERPTRRMNISNKLNDFKDQSIFRTRFPMLLLRVRVIERA